MKNFKKSLLIVLPLLFLGIQSCGDDTPGIANLEFHFNYTVNGQPFSLGQVYEINGTAVSFEYANFYVGGMVLHPETGDHIKLEEEYLLVTPAETHFSITEVNSGHYHKIQFFVGIDDKENDQSEDDFTSRASSDPLGMHSPSMHWGWLGGYKYIRVDGMTDTDGDGTPETPLAFHLGNNEMHEFISNFEFEHTDLMAGENQLQFEFDIAKLFAGMDLKTEYRTHVANNFELAVKYQENLTSAITASY